MFTKNTCFWTSSKPQQLNNPTKNSNPLTSTPKQDKSLHYFQSNLKLFTCLQFSKLNEKRAFHHRHTSNSLANQTKQHFDTSSWSSKKFKPENYLQLEDNASANYDTKGNTKSRLLGNLYIFQNEFNFQKSQIITLGQCIGENIQLGFDSTHGMCCPNKGV